MELPNIDRGKSTRQTSPATHGDEPVCRFFLCALCRGQAVVCSPCDRGQIYCSGTCAQKSRRDRQREARRRHQATPRGRAMHAIRNRRYRARKRCVTDQGPANACKNRSLPELRTISDSCQPLSSRNFTELRFCLYCGCAASKFLRLAALSPGYHRRN
jgi:hypothetical protein